MLRLLLDEHISPDVADGLKRRNPTLLVHWIAEWEGGDFLGKDDVACLAHAFEHGLTLVTYDRRTIPLLLKGWAEEGRQHGGVIFVDEKTIPQSDIGGLVRAIGRLSRETGKLDWIDRIYFLSKLSSSTGHLGTWLGKFEEPTSLLIDSRRARLAPGLAPSSTCFIRGGRPMSPT